MWWWKMTRRASARILGEYDGDGRTVPRLPVRNLPVACSGQQLLLQRVWAGFEPVLAVRGTRKERRAGNVEGKELFVQGICEEGDSVNGQKNKN